MREGRVAERRRERREPLLAGWGSDCSGHARFGTRWDLPPVAVWASAGT